MRVSLLASLAASALAHAPLQSSDKRRSLSSGVRAQAVDKQGLVCQIGVPHTVDATNEEYDIPYYYAVGTNTQLTPMESFDLQQTLFATVNENIAWCYQESDVVAMGTEEGDGRRLTVEQKERRERFLRVARNLGILSVAPGGTQTDFGSCPDKESITTLMEETEATSCRISKGIIRVVAHDVDNLEYLSAVLRDALEYSINEEQLWKEWVFPGLSFLLYVGDTVPQVYSNADLSESDDDDDVGAGLFLILGVGIPVVFALIVAGLLVNKKRKRDTMTTRQFHGMMNSDFVLVGTGDPPGSFHEGLYHYMRNGTRYLSTRCEGCLETRKNSFFTDHNLGTILEDSVYEEDILVSADSKNLGGKASTMDVHHCSSTTCRRCTGMKPTSSTLFLKSRRPSHVTNIPPLPEHAEV